MNFHIKALSIGTTVVIWFIVAITILMELFEDPIKTILTAATGHHWVSKGALAILLFAATYGICAFFITDTKDDARPVYVAIGSAILGGLTILLFFVWHFFA